MPKRPPAARPVAPQEAVDWFLEKAPIPKDQWEALDQDAQRRAFTVAEVSHLGLLTEVWQALGAAIERGDTFEDFKKGVGQDLEDHWGREDSPRLEVIFRNNVQAAYSAGRFQALNDPTTLAVRPFWSFEAILDSRTSEICSHLDGTIRPADDPWWNTHHPPLHHQCRSIVRSLTAEEAEELGLTPAPPQVDAQEGFGGAPDLGEWAPKAEDYPPELWAAYQASRRNR